VRILFVCTGNICRSPMAEAFAGAAAPHVVACSAGTGTEDGRPASAGAISVMHELGIDLTAHRSRTLATALGGGKRPDIIYALEPNHAAALRSRYPEVADRVAVLRPDGKGVPDPYGDDLEVYRSARDAIRAAVTERVPQW
jgi:protein-tyrosine phosphatase